MLTQKEFYNPEKDITELYTEKWLPEVVQVKDVDDLLILSHYWQDNEGELWTDFDHPMENVTRAFDEYRQRKDFMAANDIYQLRQQLGLSVRDFADRLGISPSALSQIETNRRVQTKYQDNLFKATKEQYLHHAPIFDKTGDSQLTFDYPNQPGMLTGDLYRQYQNYDVDVQSFEFTALADYGEAA